MTDEATSFDQAVTAVGQAWLGGVTALQRLVEGMYGAVHEGAYEEDVIRSGRNEFELTIDGPRQGTPLEVTALDNPMTKSCLTPEQLWVTPADLPDLKHGESVVVVVTAFPTPRHSSGSHHGALLDASGALIDNVNMIVSPPPVPPTPS